jgi:hypothetical protein
MQCSGGSIRGAIRKLRLVLKDDAETPRFIQTVTGQGYRFVALVITHKEPSAASEPEAEGVPTSDRDFVSELDSWLQTRRLRLVEPDQDRTAEKTTDAGTGQANRKSYRWLFVGAAALLSVACLLSFLIVRGWRRASKAITTWGMATIRDKPGSKSARFRPSRSSFQTSSGIFDRSARVC